MPVPVAIVRALTARAVYLPCPAPPEGPVRAGPLVPLVACEVPIETPAMLRPATARAPVLIMPIPDEPRPCTVGENEYPCAPLVPAAAPDALLP